MTYMLCLIVEVGCRSISENRESFSLYETSAVGVAQVQHTAQSAVDALLGLKRAEDSMTGEKTQTNLTH